MDENSEQSESLEEYYRKRLERALQLLPFNQPLRRTRRPPVVADIVNVPGNRQEEPVRSTPTESEVLQPPAIEVENFIRLFDSEEENTAEGRIYALEIKRTKKPPASDTSKKNTPTRSTSVDETTSCKFSIRNVTASGTAKKCTPTSRTSKITPAPSSASKITPAPSSASKLTTAASSTSKVTTVADDETPCCSSSIKNTSASGTTKKNKPIKTASGTTKKNTPTKITSQIYTPSSSASKITTALDDETPCSSSSIKNKSTSGTSKKNTPIKITSQIFTPSSSAAKATTAASSTIDDETPCCSSSIKLTAAGGAIKKTTSTSSTSKTNKATTSNFTVTPTSSGRIFAFDIRRDDETPCSSSSIKNTSTSGSSKKNTPIKITSQIFTPSSSAAKATTAASSTIDDETPCCSSSIKLTAAGGAIKKTTSTSSTSKKNKATSSNFTATPTSSGRIFAFDRKLDDETPCCSSSIKNTSATGAIKKTTSKINTPTGSIAEITTPTASSTARIDLTSLEILEMRRRLFDGHIGQFKDLKVEMNQQTPPDEEGLNHIELLIQSYQNIIRQWEQDKDTGIEMIEREMSKLQIISDKMEKKPDFDITIKTKVKDTLRELKYNMNALQAVRNIPPDPSILEYPFRLVDFDFDESGTSEMVTIGPNRTKIPRRVFRTINWHLCGIEITRKIVSEVFDLKTLATSSLTGRPSFCSDKSNKVQLDPLKVEDIIFFITKHKEDMSPREIRLAIAIKCHDAYNAHRNFKKRTR